MSLTPQELRQILDVLEESVWDEAEVTVGDVSIAVTRNGATLLGGVRGASTARSVTPAAPVLATATTSIASESPSVEGFAVLSPSVGLFWRSPRPGAPPFVEVGQVVQKGTVLAIVEVMKLMNHVVADRPGTVVVIHVENATEVEYGQPLMTIAP